jgi:hypothetical protein
MKAILVIDVQMTEDGNHICDSCPVWDEKMCGCKYDFMTGHKGCPLKPMPMKKASLEKWFAEGGTYLYTYNPNDYDKGWNDCIDFLEGDMQDD